MSAVKELTIALIKAGMDPVEVTILIARAGIEMAPSLGQKSSGAARQQRYRERNKTVTNRNAVTPDHVEIEASQTVTNRNESVTRDALSLSNKEDKKIDSKKKKEGTRGSRLLESWVPSDRNREYAIERGWQSVRIESEGRKFRNYWCSKAGQGATKVNWDLTWENWIDNTIEREGTINGKRPYDANGKPAGGSFFDGLRSLAADIAGDGAASGIADEEIPRGRFEIDV